MQTDGAGALTWEDAGGGGTDDISIETANPKIEAKDTDCTDSDVNFSLSINATNTASGAEDIDVTWSSQVGGTLTAFWSYDASADQLITGADTRIMVGQNAAGNNPEYGFQHSTDSGLYATGSQMRLRWSGSDKIKISSSNVEIADELLCKAGTVSFPGLSWNGDTNSGWYRPTADQISMALGGAQKILYTALKADFLIPVKLPSFDDTGRDALSPEAGWMIWNTDSSKPEFYTGSGWIEADGTAA